MLLKKYTLKENLIGASIGLMIAIPLCVVACKSQDEKVKNVPTAKMSMESIAKDTNYVINDTTIPVNDIEVESIEPITVSLGEFKVTAYCACEKCCGIWATKRPLDANGNPIVYGASGSVLTPGYSIATDPSVIPYGTEVYINGNKYIAEDCGGAIKGNRIDIYMGSHDKARAWGVQNHEVFLAD